MGDDPIVNERKMKLSKRPSFGFIPGERLDPAIKFRLCPPKCANLDLHELHSRRFDYRSTPSPACTHARQPPSMLMTFV